MFNDDIFYLSEITSTTLYYKFYQLVLHFFLVFLVVTAAVLEFYCFPLTQFKKKSISSKNNTEKSGFQDCTEKSQILEMEFQILLFVYFL